LQVEFHQLEYRYANLRIRDAGRLSRLVASLQREGQQTPVLVVPAEKEGRYVLIDGHLRVTALRHLGHDLAEAVVLPVGEAEALVLSFRLETGPKRSALEEAWLLRELIEGHGRTQRELAVQLRRSASWVSRRLDLVRVLPLSAQEAIRSGIVPVHAATKYLVPFIFVYNPSLLFEGPLWLTAFSFFTALAGVWALSAAIEGWLHGRLNVALRGGLIGCAILLLYPPQLSLLGVSGYAVTIAGGILAAIFFFFARGRMRDAIAPAGG